jgi:transcriptional regulator of arginine metabolism
MKEMSKTERQRLLKRIISDQEIHDQVQLQEALHDQGVETTQATISRDLQEMGVAKIRVRPGIFKYTIMEQLPRNHMLDQLRVLFNNFVFALNGTGNLLLIRTSPGNANSVASLIDRIGFPGVLGTVAGDDTVLLVADTAKNRRGFQQALERLTPEKTS